MDDLKLLVEMIAHLPSLTVWVLAGYLLYKVAVVGSVFGIIRLLIVKVYEWGTQPRRVEFMLDGLAINDWVASALKVEFARLCRDRDFKHIYHSDVDKLRGVLDTMEKEGKL